MVDTLCFIPCCKRKSAYADRREMLPTLNKDRIPETWQKLQTARKTMSLCIEEDIQPCTALRRYDGGLYNSEAFFREEVARYLEGGGIDLYVISAGYGLVHAFDPIHPYEAEMKGSVAALWRDMDLVGMIAELIHVSDARRIFGFFAGPSHWSGAHAKYRYFFTEATKAAVAHSAMIDAAVCFHRKTGYGANAINGAIGRTLLRGLRTNFSTHFLAEHIVGRLDGNVVIRSESIHEIP